MKYRYLLLVAVMLLWASPALAKVTFGVPEGGTVSEAGARALGDYLQQRLREPVETRSFKDEKTLHTWLQQFRMVDLAILSRDYVRRQPPGEFFPLVELQSASGAPGLVVMRQGTGSAERGKIEQLLLGMADDASGRQVLQSLGASRMTALSGQVGGARGAVAAQSRPAPPRPPAPAVGQSAAASRPLMPPPVPSVPSAASPLRVGVLGASSAAPASSATALPAAVPLPIPGPAPTVARRPEPPLPIETPVAAAPAPALPTAPAPVVAVPSPPVTAPTSLPEVVAAPPAPVVAAQPAPQPLPQVARLEPPKPAAPIAPPAPAPREALVPEPPKPRPAPVQPVITPGARQVYIAPFATVMVPGAFSEAAFDHFVDTLMNKGEKQGLEFIILKGGVDRVDKGWLVGNSYLTGEIFGYVEDKGASSTDIRTRSRIKLFPHGSAEPAIELESPAKVFFDHDYSTLEKERKKLAEQMASELASQVLASLAGR